MKLRCYGSKTVWPSGLRRWLQAPVRKGVGSNPTAVILNLPRVGGSLNIGAIRTATMAQLQKAGSPETYLQLPILPNAQAPLPGPILSWLALQTQVLGQACVFL